MGGRGDAFTLEGEKGHEYDAIKQRYLRHSNTHQGVDRLFCAEMGQRDFALFWSIPWAGMALIALGGV